MGGWRGAHSNQKGVPMKKALYERRENNKKKSLATIYTEYYRFQVRKKGNGERRRANIRLTLME